MAIKEIRLVVVHPVLGRFVARKITDPKVLNNDAAIDRTVNLLQRKLAKEHSWPDCEPAVWCETIREDE